jgi:D-alanyl-D-alanine dipeptidase
LVIFREEAMKKICLLWLLTMLLLAGCASAPSVPAMETKPSTQMQSTTASTEVSAATEEPVHTTEETTQPATEELTQPVTEEITEPVPEPLDTEFVRILDYIPTALVRLAYATEENFTGVEIYNFTEAYLRYGTVKKLMQAAALLESEGVGLLIWDAFRPVAAQQRLWEAYPDPAYVSPPGTGTQSHCRGCAVDLTLYDLKTGLPLEMPTGFDDFSRYADRDYSDASPEAAANALLLERTMAACGFKPYSGEWWHFTDTDSYEIEFAFDPATNS